ncbi:hypothetical protein [Streptacidiphilus rugosus]|uniref:hypothetical protein n=1 Tax=Streptacidiphilus rugosus TaxID=405783 RepID=UPI00055A69AB|nr:hypothetical protein [Streptacidiphilus rugosus]
MVPAPSAPGNVAGEPQFLVRHSDGTPLLRRAFRGWGNLPPALPPFAVMRDRFALLQAVVLADRTHTVALVGGPYSEKLSVAAALAHRSWRFVSGQLLVLDLANRQVMPFLLPLEARGRAAARMRAAGLPEEGCRSVPSAADGELLLIRPECLGGVVPVHARVEMPTLVRLCRSAGEGVRLTPSEFTPHVWPPESSAAFAEAPRYQLELASANGAEEAAGLIDAELTRKKDDACLDVPATSPAVPAGLTASLLT